MCSNHSILRFMVLILLSGVFFSCASPTPPVVNIISDSNYDTIQVGAEKSFAADVIAGKNPTFRWTAAKGTLSATDKPSVIYTAPNSPGSDNITLEVTSEGVSTIKNLSFNIVAAPATPTPTLAPTPLPAPTLTATPAPRIVVDTESDTGWTTNINFTKGNNANNHLDVIQGRTGKAIELVYDIGKDGYVVTTKTIPRNVLSETKGISFFYKGSGDSNSIEFKLMLRYPGDKDDTTYGVVWTHATNTNGDWVQKEVLYTDFSCWFPGTNCAKNRRVDDLTLIDRLDFVVSNRASDTAAAGKGRVAFDDVWGIPSQ